MKKKNNKIIRFFKFLYIKLFRINDSPQKIAMGLGIGVCLGIIPGTGIIAALFIAWALKINKASALLGTIITNTWLSVIMVLLSAKVGALILGLDWQQVYGQWMDLAKDFKWTSLFKVSVLKVLFPLFLGNVVIGVILGFLVYLVIYFLLRRFKNARKSRIYLSR